jgi:RNA polymerase sigma-70 factor, ECF subfamily
MRLRKRSYQVVSMDEMLEPGEATPGLHEYIGGPDRRLSGSVDRMDLEWALKQLPRGYRAVFILHDVQGYEHNEIAAIRGCSLGNSKSQLHKARARLRQLLQTAGPEKNDRVARSAEPVLDVVSTIC